MQPYFFPYIGYFQLINMIDKFVIYDNIQYTKKGWINRNRFLVNGRDSFFSIDFNEFKIMVDKIRLNEKAYGVISYDIPNSSKINLHGRKSLFAVEKIKKGEKFTDKNVKSIRPYHGLHPKYYKYLLSKRSNKNIDHGDPIKIKYVKK